MNAHTTVHIAESGLIYLYGRVPLWTGPGERSRRRHCARPGRWMPAREATMRPIAWLDWRETRPTASGRRGRMVGRSGSE